MAVNELTKQQIDMLNHMCISAENIKMGTLLHDLVSIANAGGTVFVPHVSEDYILTWTNNGGLENPPPINLKVPTDDTPDDGSTIEAEWENMK